MPVLLVCNHVTRRPCWGLKQKKLFSKNLHENRVLFPEERNAFVLDHQHGRRDVTCKPATDVRLRLALLIRRPFMQTSTDEHMFIAWFNCCSEIPRVYRMELIIFAFVTSVSARICGSFCRYRGTDYVKQKKQYNPTIKLPRELSCLVPLFLLL